MSDRYLLCSHCPALNRIPLERVKDAPRCGKCKNPLPTEPVQSATPATLDLAVRSSAVPVIVDFWAPWCGPCRSFAPTFQRQAELEPSRALYLKLNAEEHPEAARRFGIQGIPTLIAFASGREQKRQSGAMNPDQLKAWLG